MTSLKPALKHPGSVSPSRGHIRFAVASSSDGDSVPEYHSPFGGAALSGGKSRRTAAHTHAPRPRRRSPSRTDTVNLFRRLSLADDDDGIPGVTTEAPGHGILAELYDRDKARGRLRPVSRSRPRPYLTADHLLTLAKYSVKKLNGSNFFLLWRVMSTELCTVQLGSGAYGSVFRVCKDDGCASCVAVKFGIAMNADGTVPLDAVESKPHDMSNAEWAAAVRSYELQLGPTLNYDGVSWDEVRNTQAITDAVYDTSASPHVMRYLHHFAVPHGLFLFLEYVAPYITTPTRVASLADYIDIARGGPVLAAAPEAHFKALMFQAVYTIAALQAAFPGFRHNDTKLDNWGITRWDGSTHTYGVRMPASAHGDALDLALDAVTSKDKSKSKGKGKGKGKDKHPTTFVAWQLPAQKAMLKLLDFGIAHSSTLAVHTTDVANAYDIDLVGDQFYNFGTVAEPCPLYDLHLMFNLLLRGLQQLPDPPTWLPAFAHFVYACIPRPYFAPPLVNEQYRLTVDAQRQLNADMLARRASGPLRMLLHPYFAEFRMHGASSSATKYNFMTGRASV